MRGGALAEGFNLCFSGVCTSVGEIFIWAWGLGTGLIFYGVLRLY